MGQRGSGGGGQRLIVAREYCCPEGLGEGESSVLDHSWKNQDQGQLGIGLSASDAQKSEEDLHGRIGDGGERGTQRSREEGWGGHPTLHALRIDWKEKWIQYGIFRWEPNDFVKRVLITAVSVKPILGIAGHSLSCSLTGEMPEEQVSRQAHGEACSREAYQ